MYTVRDHEDLQLVADLLHWGSEIINRFLERHRLDLSMQEISLLSEGKRDADLGERAIQMADRYIEWREPPHQHEQWQIRDDGCGPYCAACGSKVVTPS